MSIVRYKPHHIPTHNDTGREKGEYDTITNSNRECGDSSVLLIADATPTPFEYYHQKVDLDDALANSDPGLSPVYQQYCRYSNLIVYITSPAKNTIDTETNSVEAVGEGIIPKGLVPNVGDVLIDKSANTWKMYRVSDVTLLTYSEDTNYNIEFTLAGVTSVSDHNYIDLQTKTNCDRIISKSGESKDAPVEELDVNKLLGLYCSLANDYIHTFVHKDTDLLLLESNENIIYDRHLATLVQKIINVKYFRHNTNYRLINVHEQTPYITTLNTLLNRNSVMLGKLHTVVPFINRNSIRQNRDVGNIRHTPCTHISELNDSNVDDYIEYKLSDLVTSTTSTPNVNDNGLPYITNVTADDSYIWSDSFYNDVPTSVLETLVVTYMKDSEVTIPDLLSLYDDYKHWDKIERFYFTPVVLLLTHYVIEGNQ